MILNFTIAEISRLLDVYNWKKLVIPESKE